MSEHIAEAPQEPVLVRVEHGVARLTLNNPRRRNAITAVMAQRMVEFCDRVDTDDSIGAVVVEGAGDYFCSGADTRDLAAASADPAAPESVARISAVYQAFVRVGSLAAPTIAVVRGGAVGAGLNLALAADVLLVTPDAVLDSGFLARGIHPGGGHLALLGRRMGWSGAVGTAVFGRALTGAEAARRGLAYAALPAAELPALTGELLDAAARDPELTRRALASARLELGPPAVPWASALEIERGVQMWSMARKGAGTWSPRGPR